MPQTANATTLPPETLDLSRIPDADAEEILKIAKQEARRALGMGADSTLKEHLESEGVLAACKAYCVWPGGKSILGYARRAARNKITDELRSEANSDATRGYAADVLNLSRRSRRKAATSEDGARTDQIDDFIAREARLRQDVPTDFPGLLGHEVTDTITFGKTEELPVEIAAVIQGYSYDAAAVHVGLLDFVEAHLLPSLNPRKRKQAVKRIENAFLRFRKKLREAEAAARKPSDDGLEPEYWPPQVATETRAAEAWARNGVRGRLTDKITRFSRSIVLDKLGKDEKAEIGFAADVDSCYHLSVRRLYRVNDPDIDKTSLWRYGATSIKVDRSDATYEAVNTSPSKKRQSRLMLSQKILKLRALASRPGTAAEGKVAAQKAKKLEALLQHGAFTEEELRPPALFKIGGPYDFPRHVSEVRRAGQSTQPENTARSVPAVTLNGTLRGGNLRLGAKPLHDLWKNPEFGSALEASAEIAYQAWCEAMLLKGFSGVDCTSEILPGDRNPRPVFQEYQRRNRLIESAARSRMLDDPTRWDAWVKDGRKDLTAAPVVSATALTPGQVFDIIEPAAKKPKRAVA